MNTTLWKRTVELSKLTMPDNCFWYGQLIAFLPEMVLVHLWFTFYFFNSYVGSRDQSELAPGMIGLVVNSRHPDEAVVQPTNQKVNRMLPICFRLKINKVVKPDVNTNGLEAMKKTIGLGGTKKTDKNTIFIGRGSR